MFNNVLEISERSSKNGRVPIKIALLKVHEDKEETNINGIHWKEEYVLNAADSAKGMPFCAEFSDVEQKDIPFTHGLTGETINKDGMPEPLFENSEVVGMCESVSIETIKDENQNDIKVLVGYGFLYAQRYPKFVSWVRKNYVTGKVNTSIEIMGTPENENKIIYEEDSPTEKYRTPKIFAFSGDAFLSVDPADDSAIVLEIAEKKKKEENKKMEEFNMNEVKSVIQTTISELNDKTADYESKISELNSQIEAKDAELADKDAKIVELNASVEKIQQALDKMKEDYATYWDERKILEEELAKAKVAEKIGELNEAMGEFTEEEKAIAKDDIDKLTSEINACTKKEELANVDFEINSIKSKICMNIVAEQKKVAEEARIAEMNSANANVKVGDIFSEICEYSEEDNGDDVNIF